MATVLLIIIYIAFISLGLPDSIFGSAWPAIHQDLKIAAENAGIIYTIVALGTVISSFFSEKIINRLGTGLVTAVSVLMTAGGLLGISYGHHFIAFCIMAIPLGLGGGSVDAALNNYVALHYSARHMSWLHCFWGVGATVGPTVISFFIAGRFSGGWPMGYRVIGALQLILTLVLFGSLKLWKRTEDNEQRENKKAEAVKLSEVFRLPGVRSALISFFCYCGFESTAGLWGSSFLVAVRNMSAEAAARGVAMFFVGITLGRFLAGFLTIRLNNRTMIRLGELLMAVGLIWLFIPLSGGISNCGFFLIGLGCAPIYPCLIHETPNSFGSRYSQALIGIQMAFAYIGNIILPPIFGFLASRLAYSLLPFYLMLLLLLMTVMSEQNARRVRRG